MCSSILTRSKKLILFTIGDQELVLVSSDEDVLIILLTNLLFSDYIFFIFE